MEYLQSKIQVEQTLDDYLKNLHFSRKDIYQLKIEKRIRVNKHLVVNNCDLKIDDLIQINVLKDEDNDIEIVEESLDILYEDDFFLIVNKPIGIIIHDDSTQAATLDGMVANYYLQSGQRHPVYHVHRLDKETSGCILYCKQSLLIGLVDYLLANKMIKREYLALVEGKIKSNMTIDTPIAADRHVNNKYRVASSGKQAITHVTVLKNNKNTTLVKCQLQTGRTHQIRVHLASINHPILGDQIYGGLFYKRMMLHSYSLSFVHPITQEVISITCQSDDFKY